MMGKRIVLEANNGDTLFIDQVSKDGNTIVSKYDGDRMTYEYTIPAGDMVMLLNLYRWTKKNDIQNDFINPTGKNREEINK